MRYTESDYAVPSVVLAEEIARLLPDYLPGVDTGAVTDTDRRSCWVRTIRSLLEALGRQHGLRVSVEETGTSALSRQIKVFWKRGDAVQLACLSGWGDREELERAFQDLEALKAPQKLIVYSCARWEDAVLDQLSAALLRYPHHIEGEHYVSLNLNGAARQLSAHWRPILHSGSMPVADAAFQPIAGSPFTWQPSRSAAPQSAF